ncbi:helix-turn-helix transcriptional regulator [Streptomyces sp. NPDC048270]|uniref:helix-turn-helix domain-containing protein n=1 Tax=Streptomyces sp. NPDC048270 TaxID=3154615 RepID=UPI0034118B37
MSDANEAPWSLTLSEVGKRLESLRENRDLTQVTVVRLLGERGIKTDSSALSRIESGKRRTVPRELVEALMDCYQADVRSREQILDLLSVDATPAGRRRRPALWRRHAALLGPMNFEGYLEQEPRASLLRNYEPELVPGPLQGERYALHAIARMRPELKPAAVQGLVDVRMDRQRKIADGALREFHALIEEGALRRIVGDQSVMRDQLEHLVRAEEDPQNSIRILPTSVGCHPGLAGAFMLMSFPEANRDVVWVETMNRSVYFEEEEDVDRYTEVFIDLWGRALDSATTRVRLKEMIKELSQ